MNLRLMKLLPKIGGGCKCVPLNLSYEERKKLIEELSRKKYDVLYVLFISIRIVKSK